MNIKVLDKKTRKKTTVASSSPSHSEEDTPKPQTTRRRHRPKADKVDENSSLARNCVWTSAQINDCLRWIADHREDWQTNRQGSCRAILKTVSWERSSRAIHAKMTKLQEDYIRLFSVEKVLNPEYGYYTDQAVAKPVHEDSWSLFKACERGFGTPTVMEVLDLAKQDKKEKATKGHTESVFRLASPLSEPSTKSPAQRKPNATRRTMQKPLTESNGERVQPARAVKRVDPRNLEFQTQPSGATENDESSDSSDSSSEESESENYAEDTDDEEDANNGEKESEESEEEEVCTGQAPRSLAHDELSDSSSIATPDSSVSARESSAESAFTVPDAYSESPSLSPLVSKLHGGELRLYSNPTNASKSAHDYPNTVSGGATYSDYSRMSTDDLRRREREVSIEALRLCIDRERLNIVLCMRQKEELERQLHTRNEVVKDYEKKLQSLLATCN